jgi:predicted nucleic acid-binding protein
MILVDSSVWIDYLRRRGDPAMHELRQLIRDQPHSIACSEPIAMELLAGTTDDLAFRRTQNLVNRLPSLAIAPDDDFRAAADIYRAARRQGHTIRSMVDCLIAAIAIRRGVTLLHKDADFEVIGQFTELDHRSLR